MEPEAPPTAPRSVSDEERDSQIIREHRETLAGELPALIKDQGEAGDLSHLRTSRTPGRPRGTSETGERG